MVTVIQREYIQLVTVTQRLRIFTDCLHQRHVRNFLCDPLPPARAISAASAPCLIHAGPAVVNVHERGVAPYAETPAQLLLLLAIHLPNVHLKVRRTRERERERDKEKERGKERDRQTDRQTGR